MAELENNIKDPELMRYEMVPIDKLKPYANNARTHSEEQIQKIVDSIKRYGWTSPILIDKEFNLIAGHGRTEAAKLIGFKNLPAMFIEHMTDLEKRAYIIADNRLAELAGWDDDMLQYELNALNIEGFDIELTGFTLDDINIDDIEIEEDPEGSKLDGDTELKAETMAQNGDVYQLGRHRLMCGSSANLEDVAKLMNGQKAAMVFTDPPYNVNYSGAGKETSNTIMNDHMEDGEFAEFLNDVFRSMKEASADNAPAYVCYASREHRNFENALEDNGWKVRAQIIWVKNIASFGFAQYKWKHEPILYCVPGEAAAPWYGDRKQVTTWSYTPSDEELLKEARALLTEESLDDGQSTIWRVDRDTDYEHPTQKPVRIPARAILNSSKAGDAVLDLFGGSGSTLIACEHTERSAYVMELDPVYVDKIIERWERLTGEKAEKVN